MRAFEYPETTFSSITDPIGISSFKFLDNLKILTVSQLCLRATIYDLNSEEAFTINDLKMSPKSIHISENYLATIQTLKDNYDYFEVFNINPLFSLLRVPLPTKNTQKVIFSYKNLFLFFTDLMNSKDIVVYTIAGTYVTSLSLKSPIVCIKMGKNKEMSILVDAKMNFYKLNCVTLELQNAGFVNDLLSSSLNCVFFEHLLENLENKFDEKTFFGTQQKIFKSTPKIKFQKKMNFFFENDIICKCLMNKTSTKMIFRVSYFKRQL